MRVSIIPICVSHMDLMQSVFQSLMDMCISINFASKSVVGIILCLLSLEEKHCLIRILDSKITSFPGHVAWE